MQAEEKGFCKVNKGVSVRICPHCEQLRKEKRENRAQAEKIHEVLADHEVHSTRGIAEQAGLMKDGKYPDIQRAIRLLRQQGEPVECMDTRESTYKLLTEEEVTRTNFWERMAEKAPKTKEVLDLEAKVSQLKATVASLEAEVKFLTEYVREQDAELGRLGPAASVA